MPPSSTARDVPVSPEPTRAIIQVVDVLQDWIEDRVLLALAEIGVVATHHAVPAALAVAGVLLVASASVCGLIGFGLLISQWLPIWAVFFVLTALQLVGALALAVATRWAWARSGEVLEEVIDG